jgi:hypothetical protein
VLFTFTLGVELGCWIGGVGILTGFGKAPWRLALNPPVIAILSGLALNFTGLHAFIPDALSDQASPAPRQASPPHVKPQESSAHPTPLVVSPVAQAPRPADADCLHYFAEWDSQGLVGNASASVLQLTHGVELRSS